MKWSFLLFFSIVFLIYGLINYYLLLRGWQAMEQAPQYKKWFVFLFLFFSLSFIAGRFLENIWLSFASDALIWIGSFWIAAMVYFLMSVLLIDLIRIADYYFNFLPAWINENRPFAKWIAFLIVIGTVTLTVVAGRINALSSQVTHLDFNISKNAGARTSLHAVMVSDIHLGTIIGRARLSALIGEIGALKPDIVLFAGDILDEDLGPVIRQDLGSMLREIRAPLGVYGINGNHEYIGGVEQATAYLSSNSITMLRDTAVLIDSSFYLVGREDLSINRFAGKNRKLLSEIVRGIDTSKPLILMDHQPYNLQEARDNDVDLQLAGHTHHGQLWPFNFITEKIYEISRGYKIIDNTRYYVSSGFGTWGPPIRLGSRPEIVSMRIAFKKVRN